MIEKRVSLQFVGLLLVVVLVACPDNQGGEVTDADTATAPDSSVTVPDSTSAPDSDTAVVDAIVPDGETMGDAGADVPSEVTAAADVGPDVVVPPVDDGPATLQGSVLGFSMPEAYATLIIAPPSPFVFLVISDQPNVCASLNHYINAKLFDIYDVRPGSNVLSWTIFSQDDVPIGPGAVPVGYPPFEGPSPFPPPDTGQYGFPRVESTPNQCEAGDSSLYPDTLKMYLDVMQTTFELTTYGPDSASGTFIIEYEGETLSGQFTAPFCFWSWGPGPYFVDCP